MRNIRGKCLKSECYNRVTALSLYNPVIVTTNPVILTTLVFRVFSYRFNGC
jgi:hypothetical protein